MEKIKEIWGNRKLRGILFIIFYVIMFSYIFIVYGNKSEKIILPENKPVKVEKKTLNSYEYKYINADLNLDITRYDNIIHFKIDENDYYYIKNKCYLLKDEKFVQTENPLKYNYDYLNNLEELKKDSNLVKTTKYADGILEENYDISSTKFMKIFDSEENSEKEIINYSIYLKDDQVSKIFLHDLELEIIYTNFENIEKININYEFAESEE